VYPLPIIQLSLTSIGTKFGVFNPYEKGRNRSSGGHQSTYRKKNSRPSTGNSKERLYENHNPGIIPIYLPESNRNLSKTPRLPSYLQEISATLQGNIDYFLPAHKLESLIRLGKFIQTFTLASRVVN
jgi:hypothetical protein